MLTLLKLFGKSPFAPLQMHMEKVAACVVRVPELFQALGNPERVKALAEEISQLEHEADLTKNYIRNHLTKGLFLLVDREDLLEILAIQDSLADKAEDIGVLLTLRTLHMDPAFQDHFAAFLDKNLACFHGIHQIMQELDELLETSFGGSEAAKVKAMVEQVARAEHEADLLQVPLLKYFFNNDQLPASVFTLWIKICREVSALSNVSEKLANRIRMLLEVK